MNLGLKLRVGLRKYKNIKCCQVLPTFFYPVFQSLYESYGVEWRWRGAIGKMVVNFQEHLPEDYSLFDIKEQRSDVDIPTASAASRSLLGLL